MLGVPASLAASTPRWERLRLVETILRPEHVSEGGERLRLEPRATRGASGRKDAFVVLVGFVEPAELLEGFTPAEGDLRDQQRRVRGCEPLGS